MITRAKFEEICLPLFQRIEIVVASALISADLDKSYIDEIVMIGGSSRTPKVQERMKKNINKA